MSRVRNSSVRRVVLGPRAGPFVTFISLSFGAALLIALSFFRHILIREWGNDGMRAVAAAIVPLALALAYATRYFLGFIVELSAQELRLYPYGFLWPAIRLPLKSIMAVEPWREDEVQPAGSGFEQAPRLHVQFVTGDGRLFGPWQARDAEADYRRLRDLLGPLFRGDTMLRR